MIDRHFGTTLVGEGREPARTRVATLTAPAHATTGLDRGDLLARLETIRLELKAGNVETAIAGAQLLSGRCARLGERRMASLLRRAVCLARFYVLDQAAELVSEAEGELMAPAASR